MEEIQNRDQQYLVESVVKLVEHNKSHLKPLPKPQRKIIKSIKYNYRVVQRVYVSLLPDEIDEIENNFRANVNGLLSVCQTKSATKLFDYLVMRTYINGRIPYTDRHFFVSDGKAPPGTIEKKLSLRELFAKILGQVQTVLFDLHFLLPTFCFFCQKRNAGKKVSYRIV